jgi:hypothetical protein
LLKGKKIVSLLGDWGISFLDKNSDNDKRLDFIYANKSMDVAKFEEFLNNLSEVMVFIPQQDGLDSASSILVNEDS